MIRISKHLVPKHFIGLTIWPYIFLSQNKHKLNKVLINHERIHLQQQKELLVIPFFIWYGLEFLIRLMQYKKRFVAYKNISFEREAYGNEQNLNYLKNRKFYSFLHYLKTKKD